MQNGTENMSDGEENMTGNWQTQPDAESLSGSPASNSSLPKPASAPIENSKIMAEENDDEAIVDSTIVHTRRLSHDFQDAPETADTPDTGLLTQEETDSFTPRGARKALQFSDDDDDRDHVDNQSVGSSESDSTLSSQESIMLTLSERRLQNDERNANFLSFLDSKYEKVVPKAKAKETDKAVDAEDGEVESPQTELGPPRGMLIKMNTSIDFQTQDTTLTPTTAAKSLQTRYPHRESQIRLLTSLLSATMTQASRESPDSNISAYVPAPIFVTGPSGTGKTAICRDVVDALDKTASGVVSAYVNCAILEPSSIDRLVSSAYSQLKPIELEAKPKSRRRKRKHKSFSTKDVPAKVQAVSNDEDAVTGDSRENGKRATTTEELEGPKLQKSAEPGATDAPIDAEVPNQDDENDEQDSELNKRIQPGRRAKADNIPTDSSQIAGKENVNKIGSIVAKSNAAAGKVESSWTTHAAVVALGRALKPYYGRESKSCAFLVLDHAERLLSLSVKKAGNELTNYLAELLLLPKVMELNLTIIVITNNCVLDSSRKFLYWDPSMSVCFVLPLRS
jgi:Cdc6-like AAA superfamily ATPase